MEEKTYIADRKVRGLRETGKATPLGEPILEITFDTGAPIFITKKRYEVTKSFKQSDLNGVRDRLLTHVASAVYGMLHEYGLQIREVNPLLDAVVNLVQAGRDKATNILWEVEFMDDQDLNKVNEILLKHGTTTDKNNHGTPSQGGVATE